MPPSATICLARCHCGWWRYMKASISFSSRKRGRRRRPASVLRRPTARSASRTAHACRLRAPRSTSGRADGSAADYRWRRLRDRPAALRTSRGAWAMPRAGGRPGPGRDRARRWPTTSLFAALHGGNDLSVPILAVLKMPEAEFAHGGGINQVSECKEIQRMRPTRPLHGQPAMSRAGRSPASSAGQDRCTTLPDTSVRRKSRP